jgi:hypothetical protein
MKNNSFYGWMDKSAYAGKENVALFRLLDTLIKQIKPKVIWCFGLEKTLKYKLKTRSCSNIRAFDIQNY